jgi:hypothetical protein
VSHANWWTFSASSPWSWVMISDRSSPHQDTWPSITRSPTCSARAFLAASIMSGWTDEWPTQPPVSALMMLSVSNVLASFVSRRGGGRGMLLERTRPATRGNPTHPKARPPKARKTDLRNAPASVGAIRFE